LPLKPIQVRQKGSDMDNIGTFPFGQPVLRLVQRDSTKKRVFVLGVYASAVHARWIGADDRQRIVAVAVASEPEIFWRGSQDAAREIIAAVRIPTGAGRLEPASAQLNGPSGKALADLFLQPLGLSRDDAWLCDLVPHSCMNAKQALALQREYDPVRESLGLPAYNWPSLPRELADSDRRADIERELVVSGAEVLLTLGDQPLKWFAQHYGTAADLSAYGQTPAQYGRLHSVTVAGRKLHLLPLVHPRQAARLGSHSVGWAELHDAWVAHPPVDVPLAC
jgi:uracil-DNA glycosylase